jgi:hypothetical protein
VYHPMEFTPAFLSAPVLGWPQKLRIIYGIFTFGKTTEQRFEQQQAYVRLA